MCDRTVRGCQLPPTTCVNAHFTPAGLKPRVTSKFRYTYEESSKLTNSKLRVCPKTIQVMAPRTKQIAMTFGSARWVGILIAEYFWKSQRGHIISQPMPAYFHSARVRTFLLAVALCALTILAYRPSWNGGFVWDDDRYVTHNSLLTAKDGLQRIWFSLDAPSQYFPLSYTILRAERALWDLNTTGYHWVNIFYHAANALLLWRILVRLKVPGALLAAAIFALHPVQVESVAWITERKNVLMGLFFLLTLLGWVAFVDERTKRRWLWYAVALVFYLLALSAKATACTLPAALLLILWLQKKPINKWRLFQILPFFFLAIGMGMLAVWWERYHQGTSRALFTFLTPTERILVASRAVWFYLSKLIWPSQ